MSKEESVFNSKSAGRVCQSTASTKQAWRFAIYAFAILTLFQSIGCRNTREAVALSWRDLVWSRRAYNLRYGNCDQEFGDHFRAGFQAGYEDICNGGDGYVPALPPDDYRGVEYQCEEGAQCVNAWFEGYPAGVAAARKDRVGNYNDVLISRMINSALAQEKAEHVLPQDVPVVDPARNLLPGSGATSDNIASYPEMGGPSPSNIRTAWRSKFRSETPTSAPIVTGTGVDPQASDTPLETPSTSPVDEASQRRTK
jgi:hypothetical protein